MCTTVPHMTSAQVPLMVQTRGKKQKKAELYYTMDTMPKIGLHNNPYPEIVDIQQV